MTVLLKARLSRFDNTLVFQVLEQSREFFRRCAGQHSGGSQREFSLRTEKGTVNIDEGNPVYTNRQFSTLEAGTKRLEPFTRCIPECTPLLLMPLKD